MAKGERKAQRKLEREAILEQQSSGRLAFLLGALQREGPFSFLVRAVALIDDAVAGLLRTHRAYSEVSMLSRSTAKRIRLAYALGRVDADFLADAKALLGLRNELAHEWNAAIDEQRMVELFAALSDDARNRTGKIIDMVAKYTEKSTPEGAKHLLEMSLVIPVLLTLDKLSVTIPGEKEAITL